MPDDTQGEGWIGSGARLLRLALQSPRVQATVRTLTRHLDPDATGELVEAALRTDPDLFRAVVEALPEVANVFIELGRQVVREVCRQPTAPLRDALGGLLQRVRLESIGETAGIVAAKAASLARASGDAIVAPALGRLLSGAAVALEREGESPATVGTSLLVRGAEVLLDVLEQDLGRDDHAAAVLAQASRTVGEMLTRHPRMVEQLLAPLARPLLEAIAETDRSTRPGEPATRELRGRLGPADHKRLHSLAFDVPPGTRALELELRYAPDRSLDPQRNRPHVDAVIAAYIAGLGPGFPELLREAPARADLAECVTSLRSLLLFTISDPSGRFRGAWSQHQAASGEPAWLGESGSSTGFVDGPLPAGPWQAVLEVHSVVTEECDFVLRVRCHDEPRVGSVSEWIGGWAGWAPDPEAAVPARAGWLRGELHAHTVRSDGHRTLGELAERAARAGLDFLAVTDHNIAEGNADLSRLCAADEGLLLVPGEELTTFVGHFGLYGPVETVPWYERESPRAIAEVIDQARRRGWLCSLAHPFQVGDPVCTGCRWLGADPPAERFDLLEVWVGRWVERGIETVKALALWDRMWDRGTPCTAIAARDWHGDGEDDRAGCVLPRTVVAATGRSVEAVLDGLRRGAVYLSAGPHVDLVIESEAGRAGLGEVTQLSSARRPAELSLSLDGPIPSEAYFLIKRDGRTFFEQRLSATAGALRLPLAHAGRYRAEVWDRAANAPLVITNHILLHAAPR